MTSYEERLPCRTEAWIGNDAHCAQVRAEVQMMWNYIRCRELAKDGSLKTWCRQCVLP